MLTLQQLLESDSLATIVAKLNQNFQSLSLSNGGPQGIIGKQGIPGLPGRVGPIGPTGSMGPTGTITGIIPFAAIPGEGSTAGPDPTVTEVAAYGTVGPWPQSSWQWLKEYYSNGVTIYGVPHVGGTTPKGGDIFIDHANKGYWKFLDQPDIAGAHDESVLPPYTEGGAYSSTGLGSTYPALGQQLGWVGPGWYYYPPGNTTAESLNNVWIHDTSTYLISNLGGTGGTTGPYRIGPKPFNDQTLAIPNARLISKYGTVWITSGNEALIDLDDQNSETSTIGKWGLGSGLTYSQPARNNSGIDRLLFKMSLDGLPYLSNIAARGLLAGEEIIVTPDVTFPQTVLANPMNGKNFWVSPYNSISLEKFSPLLFLSQRSDNVTSENGTYGSLGIYMYTDTTTKDETVPNIESGLYGAGTSIRNNNISKTLHLFSSRYSIDPVSMYVGQGRTPIKSNSTRNYGEMVLDFRRIVASNQYVCSLPTDLKLSSDYLVTVDSNGNTVENPYYDEGAKDSLGNFRNSFRFKTNQGYISSINGKAITGIDTTADYWEYGLGTDEPGLSGYATGTHDSTSGTNGMSTRRSWYGSSVLKEKPSSWAGSSVDSTDYIRVAGMMERGRRAKWDPETETNYNKTAFLSELIFYTSAFSVDKINLVNGVGVTNDIVNPSSNAHKSLPSLYVSPYTNIGIGTFVGGYLATNDQGPQEPAAKLHVHLKETTGLADPSRTFVSLANGTGVYANLPIKTYAVAAFSGAVNPSIKKGNIDILLGALVSSANEFASGNETPINNTVGVGNQLRNAIRSESWAGTNYYTENLSTLRLGAQPYAAGDAIGRSSVSAFRNEFQISLHPLNVRSTDLTSSLTSISGVGIHNMYPRARVHFFGNNTYNETEYGVQAWRPGYMSASAGATFPYYGASSVNSASANQVVIDYIGDSYKYPVGIYEYQYYVYGLFGNDPTLTGNYSANSAVYPNKEVLSPTRYGVPYGSNQFYNQSYPSTVSTVAFNSSYKHGGTENAWWEPSSFIGFNLYRDLSSADGNILGDNRDTTKWILGTQGTDGRNHGNNGGAGIISSNTGELGIITIPRGRDGGRAYEEWEQRGLGTRDVLNHMKIVFDKNGNIAIGNAAGWDLDAYPSVYNNIATGYVNYLAIVNGGVNALNTGPLNAFSSLSSRTNYGNVTYYSLSPSLYAEIPGNSPAATINKRATLPEYIRLEVAAEKGWSRDGRMAQKLGFGYPTNATITIPDSLIPKYIKNSYPLAPLATLSSWVLFTDAEGRIVNNQFQFRINPTAPSNAPTPTINNFTVIFPHPTEFSTGGPLASLAGVPSNFIAQTGAMAAEWWGMSTDSPIFNTSQVLSATSIFTLGNRSGWRINFIPTTDTRGSANVRLNNFVYGEGFGFNGDSQASTGSPNPSDEAEYTQNLVREKRQESPKIILTFLEKTPNDYVANLRPETGTDPYLKVSTIIQSAQNESAMREYWIPKTDNTGGTFMVFTDHFGKKEKDTGFDEESIVIKQSNPGVESSRVGLHLEEVVTQEFLASYDSGVEEGYEYVTPITEESITSQWFLRKTAGNPGFPTNMFPGYVRYYNRSYNQPGQPTAFSAGVYGEIIDIAPALTPQNGGSSNSTFKTTGAAAKPTPKSTFRIAAVSGERKELSITYASSYYTNAGSKFGADCYYAFGGSFNFATGVCTGGPNCTGNNDNTKYYGVRRSGTWSAWSNSAGSSRTITKTGNISSWHDASTGNITIPAGQGGSYTFSTGSVNGNVKGPDAVDDTSNCFNDPEWNGTAARYSETSTLQIYYIFNGVVQTTQVPSTATTRTLAPGDTIATRISWSWQAAGNSESPSNCNCSNLGVALGGTGATQNPGWSLSGLFSMVKSVGTGCDVSTINDSIVKMAFGTPMFDSTALRKPLSDGDFPCPTHTFYNVDDLNTVTGTNNGAVVSYKKSNSTEYETVQFSKNDFSSITPNYDLIKVKIYLSALTPNNNPLYSAARDLVFRLMPVGQSHSLNSFATSNTYYLENNNKTVIYATFPPKPGIGDSTGLYVYDGYAELFLPRDLWESSPNGWQLCSALFFRDPQPPGSVTAGANWRIAQADDGAPWQIDKFSIEFEVIASQATLTATTTTETIPLPETARSFADRASIRRNIDYFYSIFSPTDGTFDVNYDNGWGTGGNTQNAPLINNHASSIRMKRINSEFALVDFNITVKVNNPFFGGEAADSLIDFGSPRFTQYLRFTYIPDEAFWNTDNYSQDIAQDLFGNGMWFSNWSSYKNWLPGTAIVGDDVWAGLTEQSGAYGTRSNYDGGSVGSMRKNISSDWSPTFNDMNSNFTNYRDPFVRTWNGNLLEMLAFRNNSAWQEMGVNRGSIDYGILSNPLASTRVNGLANQGPGEAVYSAFGNDARMMKIANIVFNRTHLTGIGSFDEPTQKQKAFAGFLGGMYALWGNQAFERNSNVQWRMAPAYNYLDNSISSSEQTNNGFTLEVQFSKPILHVDTHLGAGLYGYTENAQIDTVQPYKYLTVSGQGIVRYAQTIKG